MRSDDRARKRYRYVHSDERAEAKVRRDRRREAKERKRAAEKWWWPR